MRVDADDLARSCSCGKEHKIAVKEIVIEAGAIKKLEEEMSEGMLKEYISPLVICDTNTYGATEEIMEDIYDRCQVLVLDAEDLQADHQAIRIVENNMEEDIDLILAVGAGTIHDISRFIAHRNKIPFISVPTAASGDGYASSVAAMTCKGVKKTVTAVSPLCIYADTDIFANAPARLTSAGVSEVLGKYICLADWKISNLVTGEYFCRETVKVEEKALKIVRSSLRGIASGEKDDCEQLMYALILSGLATEMAGNSRPASCAEHHMSHLWEMEVINDHLNALHGERVSVGALMVLKEYKRIGHAILKGRCQVKPYNNEDRQLMEETFGKKGLLKEIQEENEPELLLSIDLSRLQYCLKEIGEIIQALPEEEDLRYMLKKAGCAADPGDIGLDEGSIPLSLKLAPYTRRRLSLLRLSKLLEIRGE
ncbi:MAG: sn-glycerol-1-phosphate dehydrogenase [Clostridia bacterium]|nr:sn-glycerol-1-phosphate dehydrogenase [Clostridia bacterium]MDY5555890.1 sn-glycerol-1-phosphate dehydrogenase [Blautia sp.]